VPPIEFICAGKYQLHRGKSRSAKHQEIQKVVHCNYAGLEKEGC
jgi:hypothetical protein